MAGEPTTATVLGKFAGEIFTIHGQGSSRRLMDAAFQLDLLDQSEPELFKARRKYLEAFHSLQELLKRRKVLTATSKSKSEMIEKLADFQRHFQRLTPRLGEVQEIEAKLTRLDSAEEWHQNLGIAISAINDEDAGASRGISQAMKALGPLASKSPEMAEILRRLSSTSTELTDIAGELTARMEELEIDPADIDRLRERKSLLKEFVKKWEGFLHSFLKNEEESDVFDGLVKFGAEVDQRLKEIDGGEEALRALDSAIKAQHQLTLQAGSVLSNKRRSVAEEVARKVTKELTLLGLQGSIFTIYFQERPHESAEDIVSQGFEIVDFRFASHSSIAPLPLGKGISGGELSRLMLAVELTFLSDSSLGTLIFDEVDAGIGGEAGLIIGERLAKLAKKYQVIVVTHLAQVAVWGDAHFVIEKRAEKSVVESSISRVSSDARVREVARMLAGQSDSDVALAHAKELLEHAQKS